MSRMDALRPLFACHPERVEPVQELPPAGSGLPVSTHVAPVGRQLVHQLDLDLLNLDQPLPLVPRTSSS
jgi:hypothetical protein